MNTTEQIILLTLLKDFSTSHTPSSLAKSIHKSRWGIWKNLREMERKELITLQTAGTGKTSTRIVNIKWNQLTEKTISFALTQEATTKKRWQFVFSELEHETDFLILYGSTLHSPTTARDVDILSVAKEKKLLTINKHIQHIQKTQEQNIHAINYTREELTQEIKNKNTIILEALKKGTILYGQDPFLNFIKRHHQW